ncbi:metallophosphoesterase family protein [Hornefia butyriciproducens]|uniref:metallophosphoesterase family protein n=1 Tax=Hornefia butyriciproducens TaxID=2652293 RepID=UPI0023EF82B9|nr:metallophosphoesterase [Hornefia butyriciproducens]MDD6299066.1 metallophosphoesterase [Hornefia butyriciproducens]
MNFFVISDTHGHLEKVYDMFDRLSEMTIDGKPVDMILHCGDHLRDGEIIGERLAVPAVSVAGNCDGCRKRDFRVVPSPDGNILITHGHMEGVDYDLSTLRYLAQENGCRAACFGHTHVPVFEDIGGVLMINPGSLTFPRDGTTGSCALLNATENGFDGGIYYYEHLFGGKDRKKSRGGFLRGMINYSDRF